jgi:hypothetical protein
MAYGVNGKLLMMLRWESLEDYNPKTPPKIPSSEAKGVR